MANSHVHSCFPLGIGLESREPFIDVSMIKSASNNIFGQEPGMLITRSSKAVKEISFTCVNIQYTS